MAKRWRIQPHDPDRIAALARSAGIPAVVAQLLICRGITDPDAARVFLAPKLTALRDPEILPGCADAARKIHAAIGRRKRIVVYGDYDADGMTGTAVLVLCLKLHGADARYYIPNRIDEGYGLNSDAIRAKAAEGANMMITVDCGIGSVEEAAVAREMAVELIITDHHEPDSKLPQAEAIVHPRLPGSSYPFGGLSGSGVALKLAWALCQQASGAKKVGRRMKDFLMQAVGLAAMGTVADIVPLIDENRVLVCHGLRSLSQYPYLGISTLMKVTQLHAKRKLDI
jgi:single-stranded-DNA-specific exonuclease